MSRRNWIGVIFLMISIPALLYLTYRLGNRYYYFSSLAIVI